MTRRVYIATTRSHVLILLSPCYVLQLGLCTISRTATARSVLYTTKESSKVINNVFNEFRNEILRGSE